MTEEQFQQLLARQQAAQLVTHGVDCAKIPHSTSGAPKSKMNKWEAEYAQQLEILHRAGDIDWWEFEGISLKIADGARYTPDFVIFCQGHLECHEVKGFFREAAKVRFKVARDKYPGIVFLCLRKKKVNEGGGWERIL